MKFVDNNDKQDFLTFLHDRISRLPSIFVDAKKNILELHQSIISEHGNESCAEKLFLRFIAKRYFLNPGFGKQKSIGGVFAGKGNPVYGQNNFSGSGTHFSGNHLR